MIKGTLISSLHMTAAFYELLRSGSWPIVGPAVDTDNRIKRTNFRFIWKREARENQFDVWLIIIVLDLYNFTGEIPSLV